VRIAHFCAIAPGPHPHRSLRVAAWPDHRARKATPTATAAPGALVGSAAAVLPAVGLAGHDAGLSDVIDDFGGAFVSVSGQQELEQMPLVEFERMDLVTSVDQECIQHEERIIQETPLPFKHKAGTKPKSRRKRTGLPQLQLLQLQPQGLVTQTTSSPPNFISGELPTAMDSWPPWAHRPLWWEAFGPDIKQFVDDLEAQCVPFRLIADAIGLMADAGFSWHRMAKPLWPFNDLVMRLNGLIAQDLAVVAALEATEVSPGS